MWGRGGSCSLVQPLVHRPEHTQQMSNHEATPKLHTSIATDSKMITTVCGHTNGTVE